MDAENRDLVAAGVNRKQVASIASYLQRALRADNAACPRAAGSERRAGQRRERTVAMADKGPDGVRAARFHSYPTAGTPPPCAYNADRHTQSSAPPAHTTPRT